MAFPHLQLPIDSVMKDALTNFFSAFPDLDVEVVEQIGEEDLVSTLKIFTERVPTQREGSGGFTPM